MSDGFEFPDLGYDRELSDAEVAAFREDVIRPAVNDLWRRGNFFENPPPTGRRVQGSTRENGVIVDMEVATIFPPGVPIPEDKSKPDELAACIRYKERRPDMDQIALEALRVYRNLSVDETPDNGLEAWEVWGYLVTDDPELPFRLDRSVEVLDYEDDVIWSGALVARDNEQIDIIGHGEESVSERAMYERDRVRIESALGLLGLMSS